jgi:hypothetical protein
MPVLKAIPADSYFVRPIKTHKTQQFNYEVSGSDNSELVYVDVATRPPQVPGWEFDPTTEAINADGTFQATLYASVKHMFYGSGSVWNSGKPLTMLSGSQFYVLNLAQQAYGEEIQPGSFSLSAADSTGVLLDNGRGELRFNGSGSVVGHIFYDVGIVTIQHYSGSGVNPSGSYLLSGLDLDITFNATHTIYEHSIMCIMDVGDLNYTINPSILKDSLNGESVLNAFASGTLTPYMTTIGLYNNQNQLVALAKFPRAIKRVPESQQTVIVRFDI